MQNLSSMHIENSIFSFESDMGMIADLARSQRRTQSFGLPKLNEEKRELKHRRNLRRMGRRLSVVWECAIK